MKNKKKILSLIACLSLLSSCNKKTSSNTSCSITTSTPNSSVTPDIEPTIEELNQELFENYANYTTLNNGTLKLEQFGSNLPDNLKNLETIIIPETIKGISLKEINYSNSTGGIFKFFNNIKYIKIPKSIDNIWCSAITHYQSSPFSNLPNLINIEVDSENEWYYTSGNCLIEKEWDDNSDGSRTPLDSRTIICGWGEVTIPNEITSVRGLAFSYQESITKITLNPSITTISQTSFKYMSNLKEVDLNSNSNFKVEGNCLYNNSNSLVAAWSDVVVSSSVTFTSISLNNYFSVTSVDLSSATSLNTIANNAFSYTKIESVHIPANITNISDSAFKYMKSLKEITIDENSKYKVKNNCFYKDNTTLLVAWSDAIIPEELSAIATGLQYSQSLTSVKFSDSYKQVLTGSTAFLGINEDRDIKDFFKLVDNENNILYRVKSNCLVLNPDTNNEEVICALPDEEGNIVLPSTAKILSANLREYLNDSKGIKSITLNEGLTTISRTSYFNIYNTITKINLPSTISTISGDSTTNENFLCFMSKLTELTLGSDGKNENEYFKIENNCLINKSSNIIVIAYKDAVIPERITTLGNYAFRRNDALTSLTLHNKLISVTSKTFDLIGPSYFKTINFKGTLSEFKANVGSTSLSLYSLLKQYSTTTVNFLDENGKIVESHLMSEI